MGTRRDAAGGEELNGCGKRGLSEQERLETLRALYLSLPPSPSLTSSSSSLLTAQLPATRREGRRPRGPLPGGGGGLASDVDGAAASAVSAVGAVSMKGEREIAGW